MTWDLVADIGGTNMRVAQVREHEIISRHDFTMTPDRDVAQTLKDVCDTLDGYPNAVVAAGAGPVKQGQISLTNGGWLVCEDQISEFTGAKDVRVINDFEAAAWSLATLSDADILPIGESKSLTDGHRVAVGPGTGLGVGSLFWDGARYSVMPGEGGHVGVGPRTADEVMVFERLITLWPQVQLGDSLMVEAEAVLSGTALPYVYQACGGDANVSGRDVMARAAAGEAAASQCRDIFIHHLAALAGDLAVTLKAAGGVFLLGGVAQANRNLFGDAFWQTYRSGGRDEFVRLRESCGLYLVTIEDFGLRGCINALARMR